MRRQLVQKMQTENLELRTERYDYLACPDSAYRSNHTSQFSPLSSQFEYFNNISNHLARDFYGANELTAYELKCGSGPIMQCRHCIRYALGYCVKHGGQRPSWREPLSLVLGDGRRFRLEFDCKNCQMNVLKE